MSEAVDKQAIIADFRASDKDTGSSEVQVALLTARIKHLTEHLKIHRKDFHSRKGLIALANRRRKLLNYMQIHDLAKYNEIVARLALRR